MTKLKNIRFKKKVKKVFWKGGQKVKKIPKIIFSVKLVFKDIK